MRIVIDSNVLLASFAFGGVCRAVLDVCLDSHTLFLSEHIVSEVRQHLIEKFQHPAALADERVELLRQLATIVEPLAMAAPAACRDPDDVPVLGTALAAKAHVLVTGDKDVLAFHDLLGFQVLTPGDFWRLLH